ncbi:MAG: flagellar assembly protein FliX [Alphaproteobacteria bacterium]|nr:flagellar assembly protein FliX [Alphaproteobacteria bacterium]
MGYIAREKLIEISRFVKDNKNITDDAQLNEIISEIELRIEVELAKLTR